MTVVRSATGRTVVAVAILVLLAACSSTPAASVREARSSPVPSHVEPSRSLGAFSPPAPTAAAPIISEEPSRAAWTDAVDAAVDGRNVSVAVGVGSRIVYAHLGRLRRIPASNQKLLTSMAALDEWGPSFRFRTVAGARKPPLDGVLRGDLWIIGSGDPEISSAAMARLATRLRAGGLTRVVGSVIGDTGAFTREWWAPGWVPGLSRRYVTRATALAFDGNEGVGLPERAAASSLTAALESVGVEVDGAPDAREAPQDVVAIGGVRSAPLHELLATQNHGSVNFYAEMLLKALGGDATGRPGSTDAGAAIVTQWAHGWGVEAQVRDGSGLSHQDRVSTQGLVALLLLAGREPWAEALVSSLPGPGDGTVGSRLVGLPVHVKTGTLFETPVSSLSGFVVDASGATVAFSVISRDLAKSTAMEIEDAVVRILANARMR